MDHGKRWSFVKYKCRCTACVAANAAYMSAYRARNKEQILAKEKERYQRDKDRIIGNVREYYERERPAISKKRQELETRRKRADAEANRRARKKGQFVEEISLAELYDREKGICGICGQYCSPTRATIDHIMPLSRGGLHAYANVQIAHGKCNGQKRNRLPVAEELERVVYSRTVESL